MIERKCTKCRCNIFDYNGNCYPCKMENINDKLKEQLKEAESVIEFYCHHDDVFGSHGFDISCEACTERPLGKCAREYLAKYKTNE